MCGIYGMVAFTAGLRRPDRLAHMAGLLRHRGPDGHRRFQAPGAALGAARLRIVDPSPSADQPFHDPSGSVWLACNGEIYNAASVRARYPAYPYRSRCDVEPIVPLYLHRGIAGLAELEGMFAIAVWDTRTRRLVLARDRAGEKPLFHARRGGEVWFASEVRPLLDGPGGARQPDPAAMAELLTTGHVREPRTAFEGVRQVEAGTVLTLTATDSERYRYWHPPAVAPRPMNPAAAVDRLRHLLPDAVGRQLAADVPIGVFLSGGVDSSVIAHLAGHALGAHRLHTFTVGFEDPSFDERGPAAAVAASLGSRHVTVRATEQTMREALDALTAGVAEPIADPAAVPTYLLAREARRHVGVALSGEGADELFGGYPTYLGHRLAPWYLALPAGLRRSVRTAIHAVPTSSAKVPVEFLLKRFVDGCEADWRARHRAWFGTGIPDAAWLAPADPVSDAGPPANGAVLHEAMLLDYRTYLRDGLLPKLDRTAMLCSLETRAPFLDGAVTEFALGLDPRLHVRGLTTKWLLKQAARAWLPRWVVRRRKRGLSLPLGAWLNGGLRGEVDRLLAPARVRREGLLQPDAVRQLVAEQRSGRIDHARALWTLLVMAYWRERWLGD